MAKQLVIFGATSQARLAYHYFNTDSEFDVAAFTVDRAYLDGDSFCGLPLVPFEDLPASHPMADYGLFVALGYTDMNRLRADRFRAGKDMGYTLPSYVSSRCTYLSENPPGDNCLILEDNTIQPFVSIGDNVTLWSGNHIGHDVVIRDHVFVTSHVVISGFTRVEPYCFLGVNSSLRDDITIGEASLIGAGATIMSDTEPFSVYLPPRATKIERRSNEIEIS